MLTMERRFPLKLALGVVIMMLAVAACQGATRTEFVIEMTREVTVVVIVTATPEDSSGTVNNPLSATVSPTVPSTETAMVSPTPDIFPTPVVAEVIVAEQQFEHGRMFYIQPIAEIWVLYNDANGLGGIWERHEDTWEEGMADLDPNLEPPDGLAQPIRGFGKLWREGNDVRNRLGWAIEPEAGHVTVYRYEAGGNIVNGVYQPGPGKHLINSREPGTTYIFDEDTARWSIAADPNAN